MAPELLHQQLTHSNT